MILRCFLKKKALLWPLVAVFIFTCFTCKIDQKHKLVLDIQFLEGLDRAVTIGTFELFENPGVRKGRKVILKFIILPATGTLSASDPIFVFDGGPGCGAAQNYQFWADYFKKMRKERDIVLIDQRGTGESNPLRCYFPGDQDKAQTFLTEILPVEYVKNCRSNLEKKYNLEYYHSVRSIDDTDALRAALGYDKINVYGGSYGSNTALLYMKHYRENVRTALLEAVAPPNWNYPACLAQDTEVALQRFFSDCEADPLCQTDYPDLRKEFYELLGQLKKGPIYTQITNPINSQPEMVQFYHCNFIHVIRSLLYSNTRSCWIPVLIHWAYRRNWAPLVEYTVRYLKDINENIMDGLWLCVTCSETIPFIDLPQAAKDAEGTFMGTYRVDQQTRACDLWPRGILPPGFLDLVRLEIPAVLISGEIDPTTPPYHARKVVNYLPNSLHIIVPNAAHNVGPVWQNCLDDLMVQFFRQGTVENLDPPPCVFSNVRPPFVSWRDYTNVGAAALSKTIKSLATRPVDHFRQR